jgi:alkylation response protein AidB-like acyl-CoA dehydrogenase
MSDKDDTTVALRETAQRWVERRYGETRRRATLAAGGFDEGAWREMAKLGWLGIAVPETQGGSGLSDLHLGGIVEVVGAANLPEPLLAVAGMAAPLLSQAAALGNAGAAAHLLRRVVAGECVATLAHAEPTSGYDRQSVSTRAFKSGGSWIIEGSKTSVETGGLETVFLISAATPDGVGLFLVDRAHPGVEVIAFRSLDDRWLADLRLHHVRLNGDAHLRGLSANAIDDALDGGALLATAQAVGLMEALLDDTLAHLRSRQQFGRVLASFQVLQHRLVDMFIGIEEARAVVESASQTHNLDARVRQRAVAIAKVVGSRAAQLVGREAVQMHGGMGIADELRVSHLFRRLVTTEKLYGDEAYYIDRFSEAS